MERVLVIGTSLAGANAARSLRRHGHSGDLVMVGAEAHRPYDRPPLSKQFLAGEIDEDRLLLRVVDHPDPLDATWQLGQRAVGFEPAAAGGGAVTLADGAVLDGDGIVIATGSRPRTLPDQPDLVGLGTLRTLEDARRLGRALRLGPDRLVVIGFGFIGAEVAATARAAGWEVTIVEAAPQPMTRVLGADGGAVVADLHRRHGVEVRLATTVDQVVGEGGRVTGLALSDGEVIACSQVVVGIGAVPETDWLDGSGLPVADGVVADETLLVAPGVVAAGDVVRWPSSRGGPGLTRVEQWDNAVTTGARAGERLLAWDRGEPVEGFRPVPWFWSDQYDRKIQLAGRASGSTEIVQGAIGAQRFVQLHYDDGDTGTSRVVGVVCWNRPRQAILARRLLAEGAGVDRFRSELG
jgi:NADPH-dependent 2,4-dienoyl-CoA reductase/sulfur reductase-like enzyme